MKATKKILGSFLSFILIMTMLPVSSMRVYADNNIPENTISLQPTSVELSPSAVHSQIPFTVSAEKTENVEDIQIFFQEGTLTDGSYTIPFKVNKDPEASEGNRWASFTFRSASYSNTMAVIVNSASLSSANAGVYMGYLQWNAGFWTHESEKIKDINGQILMTLKIGYDITVSSNAYGMVSSSCSLARAGETVTLDVVANQGYQFKEWQIVSGNVTIENNQFTMPEGNVEICAIFDKLCEVNFEANGGSGTMDSDTFFTSEGYTLPSCGFTAPGGYTFKDWTVTWENEGASNSTNKMAGSILTGITENITVSANWMELSLKASPSGAGSVVYENDAFTATANAGYTFDHWEYADDEYSTAPIGTVWPTDNPYQPAEVDHKIYTAVFKANTYNLTLHSNNDERGTVTYSGTPKTGNKITLTATANEGYIFKEWQIEPTGIVIDANNKFKMPASNVTVTAVFDHLQTVTYSMTVNNGTGMTKTEDSGAASQTDLTGAMTTVVYTADDGYYFPTDYCVSSVNGISVTRNSYNQIIVSGTPTADTTITLPDATAKTTPNKPITPTAKECTTPANNNGKISGVTTAMEYKKSEDSAWIAINGSEITWLVPGTYYIRLKATDTTHASANMELTIAEYVNADQGKVLTPTFSPADETYSDNNNSSISNNNSSSNESEYNDTASANNTIPLTHIIPIISINSTDSNHVQKALSNNPKSDISPDIADIGRPFVDGKPDKNGWDLIKENIQDVIKENVSDPSMEGKVIVDMNGYSIVPGDIITEIKGQDVTVVLNLGDGIRWSINGHDVTGDNIGDIDFSVKVGTNKIPVDVINNVTGERYCTQISLSHEGDFGFTATLFVDMDKKNAGLYANLFYFNPSTEGLEFICADEIDENGVADLKFTHASDYTIAIDKEPMNNPVTVEQEEIVQENTEPQGAFLFGDDNSFLDDSNDSVDSKNRIRWWIISLMCLVLAGGFTVVWIIRKK